MIAWALIVIAMTAVPPLTDAQQAQLATAVDDSARLDEAALYPLLDNVLTWEAGADSGGAGVRNDAGARVPDYQALLNDPTAGRGELFLLEGKFAGRPRRYALVRSGEWGDALTEWVLIVRDDPEQVAVVYFVDPLDELAAPRMGADVRVAGRFYKVWADRDQDGQPTRYLTFVARSPTTTAAAEASNGVLSALPMMGAVVLLAAVYLFVRRAGQRSSARAGSARFTAGSADAAMLSDVDLAPTDQPLPQDPAEALRRLAEQQRDP